MQPLVVRPVNWSQGTIREDRERSGGVLESFGLKAECTTSLAPLVPVLGAWPLAGPQGAEGAEKVRSYV